MIQLPLELFEFYNTNKEEIIAKLQEFKAISEENYFYEMVYCLCTPMSRAENALKVQQIFEEINFYQKPINPSSILRNPRNYIRFHNQKAKYILNNHSNFDEIKKIIKLEIDIFKKRELLAKKVNGFGMKEASHFLRNIGYFGLPILDRHILRTMKRFGAIVDIPIIMNKKNYEILERLYIDLCNYNKFSVEELDLVLWKLETGKILK